VSCIERAGWSSGVLRAVKLNQSVFDLGTIGHGKAHRAEDALDALDAQGNRVQTAFAATATRQGHVQAFGAQLLRQFGISNRA
jgi:hypothetical protein